MDNLLLTNYLYMMNQPLSLQSRLLDNSYLRQNMFDTSTVDALISKSFMPNLNAPASSLLLNPLHPMLGFESLSSLYTQPKLNIMDDICYNLPLTNQTRVQPKTPSMVKKNQETSSSKSVNSLSSCPAKTLESLEDKLPKFNEKLSKAISKKEVRPSRRSVSKNYNRLGELLIGQKNPSISFDYETLLQEKSLRDDESQIQFKKKCSSIEPRNQLSDEVEEQSKRHDTKSEIHSLLKANTCFEVHTISEEASVSTSCPVGNNKNEEAPNKRDSAIILKDSICLSEVSTNDHKLLANEIEEFKQNERNFQNWKFDIELISEEEPSLGKDLFVNTNSDSLEQEKSKQSSENNDIKPSPPRRRLGIFENKKATNLVESSLSFYINPTHIF